MKTRIHCPNLGHALCFARNNGGRICKRDNGQVWWYSPEYTMTEIMTDFRGGAEIGTYSHFNNT